MILFSWYPNVVILESSHCDPHMLSRMLFTSSLVLAYPKL